jgi:hypothetical protein
MKKKVTVGLLASLFALTSVAGAAFADKPNFNPGQKGNVCSAPGPNSNPNCNPSTTSLDRCSVVDSP